MRPLLPLLLTAACHPGKTPDDTSGDTGSGDVLLLLPQAVGGALWANPAAYAELPVHVNVTGEPASVQVALDGVAVVADPLGTGDWVARVPVAGLAAGEHALFASAPGAESVEATLVLGEEGVRVTDFSTDGAAETPRVHPSGDTLWLTWTDRSAGNSEAWLRAMDGAGRWTGEKVALVHAAEETLYARTALGDGAIGVLYQSLGGTPYFNHFLVSDLQGAALFGPQDLDPEPGGGSFSGDLAWDGSGYVMVWRSVDAEGGHTLWWQRVAADDFTVIGPVALASTGPGTSAEPDAGFDPFVHLDIAALQDLSLVGWVQYRYNALLDMEIPLARLAMVRADGAVLWSELAGDDVYYAWDRECRVFATGATLKDEGPAFTAVWSDVDLRTDELANDLHAVNIGWDEPPGDWTLLLDAVDDNDEPFLQGTPRLPGTLAWWDHRAYTEDPAHGHIGLYTAEVGEDLAFTGAVTPFEHAVTIAGVSWLAAAPLGTNALLAWSDERHGGGILDPRPEVYLETAWR